MRLAVTVLALTLAACGPAATPTPSGHLLTGTMVLTAEGGHQTSTAGCVGKGGYDDLRPGADVTVRNQEDAIIASGSLGPGSVEANLGGGHSVCAFPFSIAAVPDATFYSIEVSHRGELTYSQADLEAAGWKVDLTLGD